MNTPKYSVEHIRNLAAAMDRQGHIETPCILREYAELLSTAMRPDMLSALFDMQDSLNKRIGNDFTSDPLTNDDVDYYNASGKGLTHVGASENRHRVNKLIEWLLKYCLALDQEKSELIDSAVWKWWAKYQKFDLQNARVEAVDILHFLISICQVLGMTADDVFNLYVQKNKKNFERQDGGYAVKDENDCKHLAVDSEDITPSRELKWVPTGWPYTCFKKSSGEQFACSMNGEGDYFLFPRVYTCEPQPTTVWSFEKRILVHKDEFIRDYELRIAEIPVDRKDRT